MQKVISCKRLRIIFFIDEKLDLIKEDALRMMNEKQRKKTEIEKKKKHNNFMRLWRMKRNDIHAKNVIARKNEKIWIKRVKKLIKQNFSVFIEDLVVINDSEVEWKANNDIWKQKEVRKLRLKIEKNESDDENENDEIIFLIDSIDDIQMTRISRVDDISKQSDFITFEDVENEHELRLIDEMNENSENVQKHLKYYWMFSFDFQISSTVVWFWEFYRLSTTLHVDEMKSIEFEISSFNRWWIY